MILLTNDDGIMAPGLLRAYSQLGDLAELIVVAPDRERSASGHSLTMHRPLRAQEFSLPVNGQKHQAKGWAVSGTPADCVKLALEYFLTEEPGLVVSGINQGANLGTDVVYSGTVSAALEAAIYGIPAIAVSVADFRTENFDFAALLTKRLAEFLLDVLSGRNNVASELLMSEPENRQSLDATLQPCFGKGLLLNVNVPNIPPKEIRGVRLTRLGQRRYLKSVETRRDPRGRLYFWLAGEVLDLQCEEDTDICAISEGYVSITPLSFDFTDSKKYEQLKVLDWERLIAMPMV